MRTAADLPFTPASFDVPNGPVGPMVLPGSHRKVWWTGRVAIGLRYEPRARTEAGRPSRLAEARRS